MKNSQSNKRVLVTGANGQLGRTLQDSHAQYDHLEFTFLTKNELDISNNYEIKKYFTANSFDFVVNCAAYTNVEGAEVEAEKAIQVNSLAVENLAKNCKEHDVILIHISTDYVFDGENSKPYTVDDMPNPINVYGKSKHSGEEHVKNELSNYYIIRTSWLYSKYESNFFDFIYNSLKKDRTLHILTNQKGVPTSAKSISRFIVYIIMNSSKVNYGTYHYVDDGQASWYDFAKEIAKCYFPLKQMLIKPTDTFKTRAKRPEFSVLDNSKTKSIYKDIKTWKEELKRVL